MRIEPGMVGRVFLVAALLQASAVAAQTISAYAGSGTSGYSEGTSALTAQFNAPSQMAVDTAGNLYIADTSNHAVRKVTPGGVVSTILGTGASGSALTQLSSPAAVAVDNVSGDIYVADASNHRILRNRGLETWAIRFQIQCPRSEQHCVAQHLGFQP